MKKILLLGGCILSLSSAILVITGNFQSITSGYFLPEFNKGKFVMNQQITPLNFSANNLYQTIDNVDFDGKMLTILSKTQRLGMIAMGKVAEIGSGNSYSPVVMVDKFDIDNSISMHESYPINLADIMYKNAPYSIMDAVHLGSVIGTNTNDSSLATIASKYPKAFQTETGISSNKKDTIQASYFFGSYTLTSLSFTKSLDIQKELQTYETRNVITPERVNFGGGEYKLFPWNIDFYNAKRNTIIVPVGCNRKELKDQYYKEIAYVTHDFNGKIVNQTIVKFEYTKDHEFISLVDNVETGEKQLVAILGKRMYMGKQNDPVVNKFTLLVLNPDGTQKLLKDFQYGLKPREFEPAFAFMKGDITYIVSRNKLTSTLETFVFDATGELTIQKQPSADLFAKTYGNKNGAMSFLAGSQSYKPFGLYKLSSGNMVLLTDDIRIETIPNPNAQPGSTNTTLNQNRYDNLIAFEFTPAGACNGQYVMYKNFQYTKTPTFIENVILKENRLLIMTLDKDKYVGNPFINAIHNNQIVALGCREACKPALFDVNITNKTVDVTKPLNPMFITLYGTQSYFLLNDNSGISYYGCIIGNTNNAIEFQVNTMKF
jgi:hypothetical protein